MTVRKPKWSVRVKVELLKNDRMENLMEVEIPANAESAARKMRQPFVDQIIKNVRLAHRRSKRR